MPWLNVPHLRQAKPESLVDLNTPQWLSPRFRDDVQREQVPVYV